MTEKSSKEHFNEDFLMSTGLRNTREKETNGIKRQKNVPCGFNTSW